MKFKITQKGVYDHEGKEVPVGTELKIKKITRNLLNKGVVISKPPKDAVAVTNDTELPAVDNMKVDNMKVDDLKAELDERGIEYTSDDKSADLKLLLQAARDEEKDE